MSGIYEVSLIIPITHFLIYVILLAKMEAKHTCWLSQQQNSQIIMFDNSPFGILKKVLSQIRYV